MTLGNRNGDIRSAVELLEGNSNTVNLFPWELEGNPPIPVPWVQDHGNPVNVSFPPLNHGISPA